ncbi:MAG: hypothetical protein WCJ56_10545 [bacterium]
MGSAFTWGLCNAMPERVIAAGMGGSGHIPDLDQDAKVPPALKEIPIVVTAGELDNLVPPEKWKTAFVPSRRAGYRVALVTQWGLSHFEGNYENLLLIHFDRAIAKRLPTEWDPALAPPQLRSIPLEQGWLGSPERCGEWGTLFVEACEATKFVGDANLANWFVDGTVARTWQGYSLRHNAAALIRPFVDSMEYIASRDLPAPVRAGKPLTIAALPYWFRGVTHVEFYAGTDLIATCKAPNGEPDGQAYEAVWERPTPGIHPIYAILYNGKGARCITKPCPLVVEE